MIDFSSLPDKAQAHLASVSQAVSGVLPDEIKKWKLYTRDLVKGGSEPDVINEVRQWSKEKFSYIYALTIVSGISDPSALVEAYIAAKSREKGARAYARLNKPSKCMYVGSSEKIHQRLKEHLGFGAKGTYSLHLAYWVNSFDLKIHFECAKYPASIDPKALQALEDTLWAELLPMFGRQGAR